MSLHKPTCRLYCEVNSSARCCPLKIKMYIVCILPKCFTDSSVVACSLCRSIDGDGIELKIDTDGCEDTDSSVQYLEHVQVSGTWAVNWPFLS